MAWTLHPPRAQMHLPRHTIARVIEAAAHGTDDAITHIQRAISTDNHSTSVVHALITAASNGARLALIGVYSSASIDLQGELGGLLAARYPRHHPDARSTLDRANTAAEALKHGLALALASRPDTDAERWSYQAQITSTDTRPDHTHTPETSQ